MVTVIARARILGAAAGLVLTHGAYAQGVAKPSAIELPDLSSYDCAAIDPAKTAEVRHMGQVIKGQYHEWHEIYVNAGATPKLACISALVPQAHQMSADEAKAFLADSAAIGAPSGPASGASLPAVPEPADVKPEPPMHGRRALTPRSTEQQQGTTKELPPVPATKFADPSSPHDQGASIPREHSLADALATAPTATVGIEDRVPVSTASYPFNTIGYLSVTYPDGESFRCSGTLVSPYVVLTAGHCVHNNNRGGFVNQVRFYPGQSQANLGDNVPLRPYGGKSDFSAVQTTQVWTQISGSDSYPVTDYRNDIAAVEFKTPFTFTSTFMPILYGSTTGPVTNSGYPAVVNNQNAYGQWDDSGAETADGQQLEAFHVREFAIDGSGGDSGSPFFFVDASGRQSLVGSLSYAEDTSDAAGGPWYDSWNQSLLSSWAAWTPNTATSGVISGLHLGGVFSSLQTTSQSYLRFYNSTTTDGSVTVTLANPDTGAALATWTSPNVPAGSELQFFIKDIEANADHSFSKPAYYSISVRPTFTGYMQHVLWQTVDNAITNLTNCDTAAVADPKVLVGVHSSLLASGYPSTVVIYNTGTAAVNISLGIYDARNGARVGTYSTGLLQPNAQNIVSVANMEAAAQITPAAGMYHYVVKADTPFTGYLQHVINNASDGVVTDMTTVCRLSP
jgi:V8-like Glu-specific endopeptidase